MITRASLARAIGLVVLALSLGPPATARAAASPIARYESAIQQLGAKIGAHLHLNLIPFQVILNTTEKIAPVYAYVQVRGQNQQASGEADHCSIYVNPSGQRLAGQDWLNVLAHETFHCFQAMMMPLAAFSGNTKDDKWLIEGQAEWVAAQPDIAGPHSDEHMWWRDYLTRPELPLFSHTYDAIGFYAHLVESGVDPWTVFAAMLQAPNNVAAYHAAADGGGDHFLDTWASGYFRDPGRGAAWDTHGPGIGTDAPRPHGIPLADGQGQTRVAPPFTNGIFVLLPSADVVVISVTGSVRLSDERGVEEVVPGTDAFCANPRGCACPPDSVYQGPQLRPLVGQAAVAASGGPGGARVGLSGLSLASFCASEAQRPAKPIGTTLPDPCQLVMPDDVQPIMGQWGSLVHSGSDAASFRHCTYEAGSTVITGIILVGVTTRFKFDSLTTWTFTPAANIGDEAHLAQRKKSFSSGAYDAAALLAVRHGAVWIVVSVDFRYSPCASGDACIPAPPPPGSVALALGRTALSRL